MELLDVLDKNGKPTGKVKPRSEIHRDGDWHRAAHVWIMNSKSELLIQKRAATRKYHPNRWSVSVGGHVSENENSRTSVAREVKEELGLHCLPSELEASMNKGQLQFVPEGDEYKKLFAVLRERYG